MIINAATAREFHSMWELTVGDKGSHNKKLINEGLKEQLKHGHRSEFFGIDIKTGLIVSSGTDALNGNDPVIKVRKKIDGFYTVSIVDKVNNSKLTKIPEAITLAVGSLNDTVRARLTSAVKK